MRKLRNFRCSKSNIIFERFVNDGTSELECKCGAIANRTLSAPRCFSNTTGKSPSCKS